MDLYPHASLKATPHQGTHIVRTPRLLAAEAQQWHIAAKAIQLRPNADADASYESLPWKEATSFLCAIRDNQRTIALNMLMISNKTVRISRRVLCETHLNCMLVTSQNKHPMRLLI